MPSRNLRTEEWIETLTFDSLDTAILGPDEGGQRWATGFASIQAAIDDIPTDAGGNALGEVRVPAQSADYTENVDISKGGLSLRGQGTQTRILGSGDHALSITDSDVFISNIWVDNDDADTHDAINIDTQETRLADVDVDKAGRYGIRFVAPLRAHARNVQVQGGQTDGVEVLGRGQRCDLQLKINNCPDNGYRETIDTNPPQRNTIDLEVFDCGSSGAVLNGKNSIYRIVAYNNAGDGVFVGNDHNIIYVVADGNTGDGVQVNGNRNVVFVMTTGDVTLGNNATDNKLVGVHQGTLTDNSGGANDTEDLFTA